MVTDYKFTFNLTKKRDPYIRQINFVNIPPKLGEDTDFSIRFSKEVKMKISAKTSKCLLFVSSCVFLE